MEGLRFDETLTDAKDVKNGNYIKLDVNGAIKFAQVQNTFSVKNGKHGAAKTTIVSKILDNGANHQKIYSGSDKISVYKQVKAQVKLVDVDGTTITFSDDSGSYNSVDLAGRMDPEEIKKIAEVVESSGSESYDLLLRALPEFYKLDSIKPSTAPAG